jgi:hypothetical protein
MAETLANSPGIMGRLMSDNPSTNFGAWLSDIDLTNIFDANNFSGFTPLGGGSYGRPRDPRFGGMGSDLREFVPLGIRG